MLDRFGVKTVQSGLLTLALGAALSLGLAFVSQGCSDSQSSGIGQGTQGDGAAGGGATEDGAQDGSTFGDGGNGDSQSDAAAPTTCDECVAPPCSGQYEICQKNIECRNIYVCATETCSLGNDPCVQNCFDSHPSGQADYLGLALCNTHEGCGACAALCQVPREICDSIPPRAEAALAARGACLRGNRSAECGL